MIDFKQLATQYFRGEISPEDERILYAWAKADENNMNELHRWEAEWKSGASNPDADKWARMMARMAAREVMEDAEERMRRKPFPVWPTVGAVAASLLLAVALFLRPETPLQQYAMEAPIGEKARVVLPDSSVVWLNSGSRLCFQETFNHKIRNVQLVGEGYFEVAHNERKPFSVDCNGVSVLVKGTKFNVSAYPEERYVKTSVTEGHVVFASGEARLDLLKGQSAQFDLLGHRFARLADDPEDVSAWTKSQFIYNNINLAELAEKLSRTFAVTFHFNTTEHLMDRFSISLRNNESLQDVMKALETLIPVRTRIEGDEVYVDKR